MYKIGVLSLLIAILFSCNQKPKETETASTETETENLKAFDVTEIDGQPVDYYLNMNEIHPYAVEYYKGDLAIEENEKTDSLLSVLVYQNSELTPFYYKCFMSICENHGSDYSTYLGDYCIKLLEEKTEYCIRKLRQGYPDYFTGLVANEIYRDEDWEEEINEFSLKLHLNLENNAPELRKELDLFIVGLKNDIEHIQKSL